MMSAHAFQQELNNLPLESLREITGKPDATHVSLEGNTVTDYYLAIRDSQSRCLGRIAEELCIN